MNIFYWAGLGVLMLGLILFCARVMRKGITNLDEHRSHYLDTIREEKRKLREDSKNISASEHLFIMAEAVRDLLKLENDPPGYQVRTEQYKIILNTPEGDWTVELIMRECSLKGSRKVLHGRSRWILSGFGKQEEHTDPASLMRSLSKHLRHEEDDMRSLADLRQSRHRTIA